MILTGLTLFAAAGLAGCATDEDGLANDDLPPPPGQPGDFVAGEEVTIRGVVRENTFDPCRQDAEPTEDDGLCIEDAGHHLMLEVEGALIRVVYHYGHLPPCDNDEGIRQGEETRPGETVEVFGVATGAATVSICERNAYYIIAA